jgi:hypothetical protein
MDLHHALEQRAALPGGVGKALVLGVGLKLGSAEHRLAQPLRVGTQVAGGLGRLLDRCTHQRLRGAAEVGDADADQRVDRQRIARGGLDQPLARRSLARRRRGNALCRLCRGALSR